MTHLKTYLAVATLAFTGCQSANNAGETAELWYAQPAKEWMESLPIGNGRLGCYDLWWNRRRNAGLE